MSIAFHVCNDYSTCNKVCTYCRKFLNRFANSSNPLCMGRNTADCNFVHWDGYTIYIIYHARTQIYNAGLLHSLPSFSFVVVNAYVHSICKVEKI